jgi:hypothetical protein
MLNFNYFIKEKMVKKKSKDKSLARSQGIIKDEITTKF